MTVLSSMKITQKADYNKVYCNLLNMIAMDACMELLTAVPAT